MTDGQDLQQRVAKASELAAGMEVGGYLIEGKIGEGGMGVVYGARHPRIGKRVAIKVLSPAFTGDPSTVERFEQEARLVNEIKHPNIVDVFQFGELPDVRSFFVMEWLEGESLSARLDKGPMETPEAISVLDVMCDALEAAHEKGVIHRDLKSDNVYLVTMRKERKVKLLDFGLAKLNTRGDPASISTTKSGMVVGTPAYMSPEQARGKSVDHRTDIYALGCLAYKMVTGRLPFIADNAMDLIVKQLNQPPPAPAKLAPGLPPSLSRTIVRMMAKDADERPTLAEVRQVLADLREGKQAAAASKPKRGLSILVGAMLFLLGVIALGVVGILKDRDSGSASAPAAAPAPAPVNAPAGAPPTEPAPAQPAPAQATIEFPDDSVGMGSARKPRPLTPTTPSGSGGPVTAITPELPAKPAVGAILLMLEQSSQIEIDGAVMSRDSKGGRFEVVPGSHTLRITAPGRAPVTRTVDVEPGGTAVLRIVDETAPATSPTPTPTPTPVPTPTPATSEPPKKTEDGVYDPGSDQVVPQD